MPGLPSTISVIESPTGCTKQLISVAVSEVPAAELMRPAGMKPRSCASRKRASQCARFSSGSTAASARATRARTSLHARLAALGVFLEQDLARDLLLGQALDGGGAAWGLDGLCHDRIPDVSPTYAGLHNL